MKLIRVSVLAAIGLLVLIGQTAFAIPTFQAYITDGVAGDVLLDQDSWFTTDNPFELIVVGSYVNHDVFLTSVTLAVSVPEGETGTITITGGDVGATLLTSSATNTITVDGTPFTIENPYDNADDMVIDGVATPTGYDTKSFLPESHRLGSNHYPFKDEVSDFLIYDLGDFHNSGPIHNYNADGVGSITEEGFGEEKIYSLTVTGFTRVHVDVYGFEISGNGKNLKGSWDDAPSSHDSTFMIPAPGAIFLGGIGVGLVGWLRRRRTL